MLQRLEAGESTIDQTILALRERPLSEKMDGPVL
jgi:hypothetical protein